MVKDRRLEDVNIKRKVKEHAEMEPELIGEEKRPKICQGTEGDDAPVPGAMQKSAGQTLGTPRN